MCNLVLGCQKCPNLIHMPQQPHRYTRNLSSFLLIHSHSLIFIAEDVWIGTEISSTFSCLRFGDIQRKAEDNLKKGKLLSAWRVFSAHPVATSAHRKFTVQQHLPCKKQPVFSSKSNQEYVRNMLWRRPFWTRRCLGARNDFSLVWIIIFVLVMNYLQFVYDILLA